MLKALAGLVSRMGAKRDVAAAQRLCEQAAAAFGAARHGEAALLAQRAVELDPDSAGTRFLLGSARLELGEVEAAEEAFTACLARKPGYPVVLHAQMCRALSRARAGIGRGRQPRLVRPEAGDVRRVSVVICSIHPERFARASANYRALLEPVPHEIIGIHDARSLCEGYNRGVARASGDILVFSHDDVEIVTPDFAARILGHLREHDLVGIAGTTRLIGGTWTLSGWPHLHGQIGWRTSKPSSLATTVFRLDPAPAVGVEALDGCFFAARREVFERIRFDDRTFDGWHLYDLDFSFSAHLAGFRIAVCHDVCLIHDSPGSYGADWQRYVERFEAKHRERLRKGQWQAQQRCSIGVASATEWILMTEEMISAPVAAPG